MARLDARTPPEGFDYWAIEPAEVARRLGTTAAGLRSERARALLAVHGRNALQARGRESRLHVFAHQIRSPLLLLLIFAAAASAATREWIDAGIVLSIVCATVAIGYSREYGAHKAIAALRARLHARTRVLRDGGTVTINTEEIVPGDVILLSAGSLVPADARILEAADFYVSEAVLTGESFPVQKDAGLARAAASVPERTNCVFAGTNVRSGTARCLVVRTGTATEFGHIAERLILGSPETDFDRGVRHFGYLLTSAMLVLVLVVFTAHVLRGRPPAETLLFAIALAVGLSPELLPAILTVNLARGAQMMAGQGVLVRRLNAIENLGSMDVLCTDKTGTLTQGVITLDGACDPDGAASPDVLALAAVNASLETGLDNPLDDAILAALKPDLTGIDKLAEVPFDFSRKRLSVIVRRIGGVQMIVKGAFQGVVAACTSMPGGRPLDAQALQSLTQRFDAWSRNGIRVIAVATRDLPDKAAYSRDDECTLTFAGFITFLDRPEESARAALSALAALGVSVKIITGDNAAVARHVALLVGLDVGEVLTGREIDQLTNESLWHMAERTTLFAEVDPRQKERIIAALKGIGHVVGFLGDGVNDAPAMHASDTSLSVEHAVDVAREAADFVLLERGLDVIRRGIEEGRKTFANTTKYVLTTTSANLGNMVSMAVASFYLPFLPLLAGQILLNNFLSDIPAVGIADDAVDAELVRQPERWDTRFIGRFMIEFGLLSSLFDLVTFAVLLVGFAATPVIFRTAWFIESLLTELLIALVVRTRRPLFRSRPGTLLLTSTLVLIPLTFAIPWLPYAEVLGFTPVPLAINAALVAITVAYVVAAEFGKRRFFARP